MSAPRLEASGSASHFLPLKPVALSASFFARILLPCLNCFHSWSQLFLPSEYCTYTILYTHTHYVSWCLKATKFQWSLDVNVMTCQNFRDIRNFLMLRVAKGFNLRLEIVSIRHGWCLWLCLRGSLWLCLGLRLCFRLCFRLRRLLLGAWSSLVEPSRHKKYRHPTWNCLNDLECTVWICMNHILQ